MAETAISPSGILFAVLSLALALCIHAYRDGGQSRRGDVFLYWAAGLLPIALILGIGASAHQREAPMRVTLKSIGFYTDHKAAENGLVIGDADATLGNANGRTPDLVVRPFPDPNGTAIGPEKAMALVRIKPADNGAAVTLRSVERDGVRMMVQMRELNSDGAPDGPIWRFKPEGSKASDTAFECDADKGDIRISPPVSARTLGAGEGLWVQIYRGCDLRRTVRIVMDKDARAATVRLDGSDKAEAGTCNQPRPYLGSRPTAAATQGDDSGAVAAAQAYNFSFAALGRDFVARAGSNRISECRNNADYRTGSNGQDSKDGGYFAQLPVEVLQFPWMLLILYAATGLFILIMAAPAGRASMAWRIIMPVLLYLLGLRALGVISAAYNDADLTVNAIMAQTATEILLLPLAMAFMLAKNLRREQGWLMASIAFAAAGLFGISMVWGLDVPQWLIALTLVIGWAHIWLYPDAAEQKRRWFFVAGGLFGVLALWLVGGFAWLPAILLWLFSILILAWDELPIWLPKLVAKIATWLANSNAIPSGTKALDKNLQSNHATPAAILILLAGLVMLARIFVLKEQIFGVRLSVFVMPLLIIGGAWFLAHPLQAQARWWQQPFVKFVAFAMLIMIGAAASRDSGFTLVYWIPVFLVAALILRETLNDPGDRKHRPLMLLLCGLVLLPWLLILIYAGPLVYWTHQMAAGSVADSLQPAIWLGRNDMRLLAIFAPNGLASVGSNFAFETYSQMVDLNAIAQGNWLGHGYLAPINLDILKNEQLSDHLSAVHLIWPYGRMGALAFLMVMLAFATALARAQTPVSANTDTAFLSHWAVLAARFARWVIFGSAAFMILANLQLIPFTGRNIYLLAATSGSDLLEAALLLFIASWALIGEAEHGR